MTAGFYFGRLGGCLNSEVADPLGSLAMAMDFTKASFLDSDTLYWTFQLDYRLHLE